MLHLYVHLFLTMEIFWRLFTKLFLLRLCLKRVFIIKIKKYSFKMFI